MRLSGNDEYHPDKNEVYTHKVVEDLGEYHHDNTEHQACDPKEQSCSSHHTFFLLMPEPLHIVQKVFGRQTFPRVSNLSALIPHQSRGSEQRRIISEPGYDDVHVTRRGDICTLTSCREGRTQQCIANLGQPPADYHY